MDGEDCPHTVRGGLRNLVGTTGTRVVSTERNILRPIQRVKFVINMDGHDDVDRVQVVGTHRELGERFRNSMGDRNPTVRENGYSERPRYATKSEDANG